MGVEITDTGKDLITVTMTGPLTHPEFLAMQKSSGALLRDRQHVRVLVLAEQFDGWTQGGDWGDLSFQVHDGFIAKMAIVADAKWKDLALMFTGKGLRKFPIEFFAPADVANARAWLDRD